MIEIAKLFQDLQPLAVPTEEKADPHENLTDILEIIAVAKGLRGAHLQGQGLFDEERIETLTQVAEDNGLKVLRTKGLIPYFRRPMQVDPRIIAFQAEEALEQQQREHDVLWVYEDDGIAEGIPSVVAGQAGLSPLLG